MISPLWCVWRSFYGIVQRGSNISHMGSLDEIMLNLQLYKKYIYFMMVYGLLSFLYVLCIVTLLTFWSVRGECVYFMSCLVYILSCSRRIYMILLVMSNVKFLNYFLNIFTY
jgi:hypothetical protein